MKKTFITVLGMCMFMSAAFAQSVKNKQIHVSTADNSVYIPADEMDVSHKSSIRFDTHTMTKDEMNAANNERYSNMVATDPNYGAKRNAYEQSVQQYISAHKNDNSVQQVITLPVVVHIVYGSAAQNCSDNQVLSQIQVLNEDFARTNADQNTHWSQAANTTIQFCLATTDPNGSPTTGIERRQYGTASTSWSTNDNVKHYANGGLNIWDPTRYLNIWVCNLSAGLLGYGEFPTTSVSQTFGAVIDYTCFGSNFTSYGTFSGILAPFDRGRTTTHEFSHCFNLYHIWGDDNGACSGSDLCGDTPNQADATSGCYTYPHTDACSGSSPGIMYENYMDYSDDVCLNLFTNNQKTRMLAVFNVAPYNAVVNSTACQSSSIALDAGIFAIGTPSGTICGTTFVPSVTLKNYGTSTLTSCTINYKIDNNTVQTYSWTGSLTQSSTVTVTLPSMSTTAATHTFTCYTSNPNSGTDGNAPNDQSTSTFTCIAGGTPAPVFEGFEGTTFVPAGWSLNNPDAGITWARTTACAKTGAACAKMDNWAYQGGNGQIDEMTMMAVDMTTLSNPVLTFQVAYTYWTVPYQFSDTLKVYASTDCGATWTLLYNKYGAQLQTGTPLSSQSAGWVPSASEWRMETISLLPYTSSNALMIKFRSISDFEDNLYIDDINIMNTTDVNNMNFANAISLFPNPSNDGNFNLNVSLGARTDLNVRVLNSLGQVVEQISQNNTLGGIFALDLTAEANGVYFVEVTADGQKAVQRIVISR